MDMNLIIIGEWGGAWNIETINKLLLNFEIELSGNETQLKGNLDLNEYNLDFKSGCSILKFPKGGYLLGSSLDNNSNIAVFPVLGFSFNSLSKLIVYCDSSCFDSST